MMEKMDTNALEIIDWESKGLDLDARGWTVLPRLLQAEDCREAVTWFSRDEMFRSHVRMARHGYGRGEYKYFRYPLPGLIQSLRTQLYPSLARMANAWRERLGMEVDFPHDHAQYLETCYAAGQTEPTPLLLQYGPGDFNCLHQDLYGEQVFPLQAAILLSKPNADFSGGEFVLTEQRPRMQSRVEIVPLEQGDAVVFAVNDRPVQGVRGTYRVKMRHGVSTLRSGRRHTLGVIFHDAR
jgi:uncharacterized protein